MAPIVCPADGVRLVLVSANNGTGDAMQRWECPSGDWEGPWFVGGTLGGDPIPEITRRGIHLNLAVSSRGTPTGTEPGGAAGGGLTIAGLASVDGDTVLVTPAAGKRVLLRWIGLSSSQGNPGETLAEVKFGAGGASFYRWRMGNPGAFMHREDVLGPVGGALILVLTAGATNPVDWNITYEETA